MPLSLQDFSTAWHKNAEHSKIIAYDFIQCCDVEYTVPSTGSVHEVETHSLYAHIHSFSNKVS